MLLHMAVRHGNKWMVELLLTKGSEVNAKNDNGETPLCIVTDIT
jgi:ankyrin repeat protein